MKVKKLIACLAVVIALCCMAAFAAGCNNKGEEKENGGSATVSLQFTGSYHELINQGFDFYFLGNMMSDGSGTITHAQWRNNTVQYSEIVVEWEKTTDRDGLTQFTASTSDSSAGFTDVQIYAESDGSFVWEYKFLFMGGYSRTIDFTGTDDPKYATVDAWKAFVEKDAGTKVPAVPVEPEKKAIVTFDGGEGNFVEFYDDNTALIKAYGGNIKFDYTWALKDGVITLTSVANPSETIVSTTENGVTTLKYSANLAGNQVELTFTCSDISALEKVVAKTELLTFAGGEGNSLIFYSDKTAVLSAFGGKMNFDYTWELKDGVITLTSVKNPSETLVSTTENGVTTIIYTAAFLQGTSITFTCSDISALG